MKFHVEEHGHGEPLVLVHGFTGSSESWWAVANDLVKDHRVVAIDNIGHGCTEAPDESDRYAFDRALDDLDAITRECAIDRANWLGYSMGGRLALGFALCKPDRVSSLILESCAPGIRDDAERAKRRDGDERLARRIEAAGVEAFVEQWESLPMWNSQLSLPAEVRERQREQRLRNRSAGLANSLRGMGQGAQPSYWTRLHELRTPTLLIAGALDPKFADIAARMQIEIPGATLAIVSDAGHAVHLERRKQFVEIIRTFLATQETFAGAQKETRQ